MTEAPSDLHEYVSFEDPDEQRTWVFDVTFLFSSWTCIFGAGCPGVLTEDAAELAHGCCSYGAHFVDEADEADVLAHVARLSDEQWQFRARGLRNGVTKRDRDGNIVTRIHQGACILLNRHDHPGGIGCALHAAALDVGERPLDWKPDVCWQLPLRLEESTNEQGHVTSVLREWKRRDWGGGGADFHWWCTDDQAAFVGHQPVFEELRDEIVELVGPWAYQQFIDYAAARRSDAPARWQPVAHPALRRGR